MRRFIFLIGRDDEFNNGWHLIETYRNNIVAPVLAGVSSYDVDLPADLKLQGYNGLHQIAHSILLGEAMKSSWCLDGVFTVLLEADGVHLRAWEGDDNWTPVPSDPEELAKLV